jgi:hypothetical protein
MASKKHRRKESALDRKRRVGGVGTHAQPARHRDGDRRRREFGNMAREVLQRKRSLRDWTIDSELPPDLPAE